MEQINPYAVMRNTATYEAFKAYNRRAAGAGQPFFVGGFLLTILCPQILFFGGRWLHKSPADGKWALAVLALSMVLGVALAGVGIVRMVRFRKDNPIPDEWRQVPRARPFPVRMQSSELGKKGLSSKS